MPITARPGWNRAKVEALAHELAAALAGQAPDRWNVVESIKLRVGLTALALIIERFIVLAVGDAYDGETWADNAPVTIAKKLKIGIAEARRARVGVDYEVGKDVQLMLRSLTPGVQGHSGDPDQVCEDAPGSFIVGSNRPYAGVFHWGRRDGRQPARPLWPVPELPDRWQTELLTAEAEGLRDAITLIVTTQDPPHGPAAGH